MVYIKVASFRILHYHNKGQSF